MFSDVYFFFKSLSARIKKLIAASLMINAASNIQKKIPNMAPTVDGETSKRKVHDSILATLFIFSCAAQLGVSIPSSSYSKYLAEFQTKLSLSPEQKSSEQHNSLLITFLGNKITDILSNCLQSRELHEDMDYCKTFLNNSHVKSSELCERKTENAKTFFESQQLIRDEKFCTEVQSELDSAISLLDNSYEDLNKF